MLESKVIRDRSTIYRYKSDKNNFDLIRVGLAFIVFLVHAAILSRYSALEPIANIFSAEIAVRSFFIISGFLIFMSYEKSKTISSYFSKRIRRIYPAYAFVIMISFITGLIFTSIPIKEYLSFETLKYLISNLLFTSQKRPLMKCLKITMAKVQP